MDYNYIRFCCYGAIVFGPLAIIFGMKGKETDDDPTLAQIGFILGIINIVCCILMFVAMFVIFGFYFY